MNILEAAAAQPPPPPPPPALPSGAAACVRHPEQPVTGFCASCLRERLALLDPDSQQRKPGTGAGGGAAVSLSTSSAAASALRAIFRGDGALARGSRSILPELRRSKSFSGAKADGIVPAALEPQRRSCDVRARSTLWSLFHQDDLGRPGFRSEIREEGGAPVGSGIAEEEDEIQEELEAEEEEEGIRVSEAEIVAEEVERELKPMKDHIDIDGQAQPRDHHQGAAVGERRDLKEIAGSFWLAASVFSKKLQKWRWRKKQSRRRDLAVASARAQKPASASRHFRETQSEVADYGFGRRSCDTDPRFSLDAGRISFDDPRYSFDEPRASWDGYLIGRPALPRMPLMDSVVEDAPASSVPRSDNQIPVEEPVNSIDQEMLAPGGTVQTREYYSDPHRPSFERLGSVRNVAPICGDTEESRWVANSKVSPTGVECFLVHKIGDSKDLNTNSLRDDCSESFESAYRDAAAMAGRGSKKPRRWSKAWRIWGLIHWRGNSKDDNSDERYCGGNVVDRSFSESWPELRREVNGDSRGRRVLRSNSSVSSRSSFNNGTFSGFGSRKFDDGHCKKRRDEFVLERNRSARFSPGRFDNGLLRFYLTPLSSSRRSTGSGKSRSRCSHSFTRSMLRLY